MAAAQSALVLATREQESSNELFPVVGGLGELALGHVEDRLRELDEGVEEATPSGSEPARDSTTREKR